MCRYITRPALALERLSTNASWPPYAKHRSAVVDMVADAIFAVFDSAAAAIRCACAIRDGVAERGMALRVGIHAGEVESGGGTISGITVNTGARIEKVAQPGEVLVSKTVKDLVAGSGITFTDRGTHVLKGIPGEWLLFTPNVPDASPRES